MTLLEVLDRAAAEVGKSFAGQPEVEAAIRVAVGKAYEETPPILEKDHVLNLRAGD